MRGAVGKGKLRKILRAQLARLSRFSFVCLKGEIALFEIMAVFTLEDGQIVWTDKSS